MNIFLDKSEKAFLFTARPEGPSPKERPAALNFKGHR
jgi:hypothetical protein